MKEQILENLDNPGQLERLYRADKAAFKRAFNAVYSETGDSMLARYWNERLNFAGEQPARSSRGDVVFVIGASLLATFVARMPELFSLDRDFFYTRNTAFIVFPLLTAYFAWKRHVAAGKIALMAAVILAGLLFINFLPDNPKSDTLMLSCIHLGPFLWTVLGFAFAGGNRNDLGKRLGFLTYNGDLLVMCALILIAGGILSAVTIGLFSLIGFQIEKFYFENIVVMGLASTPIVGTYLTQVNPQLAGKVSPVIARIFSPLVLIMLVIYLGATLYAGKDPYNDREFLLIFNLLLIGVMALIFFSVAETSHSARDRAGTVVLFLLSAVTIVVNGIALSAILFRISEWGFTPNRTAVLGGNILILINLLLVAVQLWKVLSKRADISTVGRAITVYLPVYLAWTLVVTFLFPPLFGFR